MQKDRSIMYSQVNSLGMLWVSAFIWALWRIGASSATGLVNIPLDSRRDFHLHSVSKGSLQKINTVNLWKIGVVMMKAKVDAATCNGCGFCARMVSGIFLIRESGKAFALNIEIPVDYIELARVARDECPKDAITLYEEKKHMSYIPYPVKQAWGKPWKLL